MKYSIVVKSDSGKYIFRNPDTKNNTMKNVIDLERSGVSKSDIEILPVHNSVRGSFLGYICGTICGILVTSIGIKIYKKLNEAI